MAKLDRSIRAGDHDTEQRGGALPNGKYRLEVTSTDIKPNAKGTGKVFKAEIEVIDPKELRGRKIFLNENIEHDNPEVERIGTEGFAKLIKACGIPDDEELSDTEDLHEKPFMASVGEDRKEAGKTKIFRYYYPDDDQPEPGLDPVRGGSTGGRERGGRDEGRSRDAGRERERERDTGRERERDDRGSRDRDEGRGRGREEREERGGRDRDEGKGRERDDDKREDKGGDDDDAGSRDSGRGGGRPWKR